MRKATEMATAAVLLRRRAHASGAARTTSWPVGGGRRHGRGCTAPAAAERTLLRSFYSSRSVPAARDDTAGDRRGGGGGGGRRSALRGRGKEAGGDDRGRDARNAFSMKSARAAESRERLMDMLRQHYHDIPVEQREQQQQRDIPFEEERQRLAFMQRIGPAGREILENKKSILSTDDTFRFSCTACGKCCTRSFSEHVLLDPHDVYLMSRAPGLDPLLSSSSSSTGAQQMTTTSRTSALLARFPKAFSQELGLYATRHGEEVQAPVLMLRGRDIDGSSVASAVQNLNEDVATRTTSTKSKKSKQGWCHFAYPEKSLSSGATIKSYAEYVQLRSEGKVSDIDMQGRVRCGFGLDHMPFACSSYPVGDLWTSTVKTNKNEESKRKIRFYWLDQVHCEGVNHPSTMDKPPLRVADYIKSNRTEERAQEWEWFKDIVGLLGRKSYEDQLLTRDPTGWAANMFFSLIHSIWYDFDSFAEKDTAPEAAAASSQEWAAIKERIEEQTSRVIHDLDHLCLRDEWVEPRSEKEATAMQERFMKGFESFLGKMVYSSLLSPETVEQALRQRDDMVDEENPEDSDEEDDEDEDEDDEDEDEAGANDEDDLSEDEEEMGSHEDDDVTSADDSEERKRTL